MKIFIGSSSESIPIAKTVYNIISLFRNSNNLKIELIPWWRDDMFISGETYVESIFKIVKNVDCAIMIFSEDDIIISREKTNKAVRDNILFEFGLFSGALGRKNTQVIKYKNPKILSDLKGVNILTLEGNIGDQEFSVQNETKIENMVKSLVNIYNQNQENESKYLYNIFLTKIQKEKPYLKDIIDILILEKKSIIDYMDDSNLIDKITRTLLKGCNAIYALDAIGPAGWLNPSTFRYLAPQFKAYLKNNTVNDNKWDLKVSPNLEKIILRAIQNAQKKGLKESQTKFDNPFDFTWSSTKNVKLENIRILLWNKEELLTPFAGSIIAIHEAFHVPLFFIEKEKVSKERDNDYILFKKDENNFDGFYGQKADKYQTKALRENGNTTTRLKNEFLNYLEYDEILFAIDARKLIKNETFKNHN